MSKLEFLKASSAQLYLAVPSNTISSTRPWREGTGAAKGLRGSGTLAPTLYTLPTVKAVAPSQPRPAVFDAERERRRRNGTEARSRYIRDLAGVVTARWRHSGTAGGTGLHLDSTSNTDSFIAPSTPRHRAVAAACLSIAITRPPSSSARSPR